MTIELRPCRRCGGTGWIPRFGHVLHGICFQCNGSGRTRQRVRPDGSLDHDHMLGMEHLRPEDERGTCVVVGCGLPVEQWPTVVPAIWWGDRYEVYMPTGRRIIEAPTRSRGQSMVRAAVNAEVENARIKWRNM